MNPAQTIQICQNCKIASHFFQRLRGLLFRKTFSKGEGLLLTPCWEIHMWGMQFGIDVIFLWMEHPNPNLPFEGFVTSFHEGLEPWRVLPLRDSNAVACLELPIKTIQDLSLHKGDQICFDL